MNGCEDELRAALRWFDTACGLLVEIDPLDGEHVDVSEHVEVLARAARGVPRLLAERAVLLRWAKAQAACDEYDLDEDGLSNVEEYMALSQEAGRALSAVLELFPDLIGGES